MRTVARGGTESSPIPSCRIRGRWLRGLLAVAWVSAAIYCHGALLRHTYRPAKAAMASIDAAGTRIDVARDGRLRITAFVHPFCPCSRVTLEELRECANRNPHGTALEVVIAAGDFTRAELDRSANVAFVRELDNAQLRFDESGDLARRFGATISGEIFAHDRDGRMVFHGGITSGRGHRGESPGRRALESLAQGLSHEAYAGPVYGCGLFATKPASGS